MKNDILKYILLYRIEKPKTRRYLKIKWMNIMVGYDMANATEQESNTTSHYLIDGKGFFVKE